MRRLRYRINPHSLGDLAVWIFVAMFFMMNAGSVPAQFLSPSSTRLQGLQLVAFVGVGLLFLLLRKLISRGVKAELESGGPGPVALAHAVALAVFGAMSIHVVFVVTAAVVVGWAAVRLPELGVRILAPAFNWALAPFAAGLWAGWRVGFAGWGFAAASFALFQGIWLGIPASVGWTEWLDNQVVIGLAAAIPLAAAGGALGSSLFARKASRADSESA